MAAIKIFEKALSEVGDTHRDTIAQMFFSLLGVEDEGLKFALVDEIRRDEDDDEIQEALVALTRTIQRLYESEN